MQNGKKLEKIVIVDLWHRQPDDLLHNSMVFMHSYLLFMQVA